MKNKIVDILKIINRLLVEENYSELIKLDQNNFFGKDDIINIIKENGEKVTKPPEDEYKLYDEVKTKDPSIVIIQFDLWIDNKKSDLTITLSVNINNDALSFGIENLRVL